MVELSQKTARTPHKKMQKRNESQWDKIAVRKLSFRSIFKQTELSCIGVTWWQRWWQCNVWWQTVPCSLGSHMEPLISGWYCYSLPLCWALPCYDVLSYYYWMAAYLGYTLRMRTLFRGWPIMVNDTHMRRKRLLFFIIEAAVYVCYMHMSFMNSQLNIRR